MNVVTEFLCCLKYFTIFPQSKPLAVPILLLILCFVALVSIFGTDCLAFGGS